MFIEKVWPYLSTPFVYVVVLVEALATLWLAPNISLVWIAFFWALAFAFFLSNFYFSRPFHSERLVFLLTLAFAQTSVFAIYLTEAHHILHLHDEHSINVVRFVYAITWFLLTSAALFAYSRNAGLQLPRIWPLVVLVTLLAAVFPLEPDSFVTQQPSWLWLLRVNLAIVGFILVSIGDAANVLATCYADRTYKRDRGHHVLEPTDADVDLSIIRTLLWSPLTLWVMFVPRFLLLAWVIPAVMLLFLLTRRWRRATLAHQIFVQRGHAIVARQVPGGGPRVAPEDLVIYLEQMDDNALRYIQSELNHRQEYRSTEERYAKQQQQQGKRHRQHHHRTDDSTNDQGLHARQRKSSKKNREPGPQYEMSDADLIDKAQDAVLDF